MSERTINVRRIRSPVEIRTAEIQARADRALGTPRATQFVAELYGIDAGYLSLDHRLDRSCAVLYEVYVVPEFRKLGIGSALLRTSEEFAASCGYRACRIAIRPDDDAQESELREWYQKRGYLRYADQTGEYEKPLVHATPDGVAECERCNDFAIQVVGRAFDLLATGEPMTKARLVDAGLELMGLCPGDVGTYFRPYVVELQYRLTRGPAASDIRSTIESSVAAMTRAEEWEVLSLVGVLGIATGMPIDRAYLDS